MGLYVKDTLVAVVNTWNLIQVFGMSAVFMTFQDCRFLNYLHCHRDICPTANEFPNIFNMLNTKIYSFSIYFLLFICVFVNIKCPSLCLYVLETSCPADSHNYYLKMFIINFCVRPATVQLTCSRNRRANSMYIPKHKNQNRSLLQNCNR